MKLSKTSFLYAILPTFLMYLDQINFLTMAPNLGHIAASVVPQVFPLWQHSHFLADKIKLANIRAFIDSQQIYHSGYTFSLQHRMKSNEFCNAA